MNYNFFPPLRRPQHFHVSVRNFSFVLLKIEQKLLFGSVKQEYLIDVEREHSFHERSLKTVYLILTSINFANIRSFCHFYAECN